MPTTTAAPEPEFLTVPEIATRLNLSRAMAYRYVQNGEIPSVKIGRTIRIRRETFEAWLKQREG